MLDIRPDGAYTEKVKEEAVDNLATTWQPNGNQMATQYSIGKVSIVKCSKEEGEISDSGESEKPTSETKIDYQEIVDLYHSICKSFPAVRSLSDSRKKAIKARLNTYTLDDFRTVFQNAEASSFLKGSNDRNWSANFDWLIADKNMAKVLEGNYTDKPKRFGRKEMVPGWCERRELDQDELDAIQRAMAEDGQSTIGNDTQLAERADKLRKQLQGA